MSKTTKTLTIIFWAVFALAILLILGSVFLGLRNKPIKSARAYLAQQTGYPDADFADYAGDPNNPIGDPADYFVDNKTGEQSDVGKLPLPTNYSDNLVTYPYPKNFGLDPNSPATSGDGIDGGIPPEPCDSLTTEIKCDNWPLRCEWRPNKGGCVKKEDLSPQTAGEDYQAGYEAGEEEGYLDCDTGNPYNGKGGYEGDYEVGYEEGYAFGYKQCETSHSDNCDGVCDTANGVKCVNGQCVGICSAGGCFQPCVTSNDCLTGLRCANISPLPGRRLMQCYSYQQCGPPPA